MDHRFTPTPDNRRGFLNKLGLTIAAGLGIATIGKTAFADERANYSGDRAGTAPDGKGGGNEIQPCGIYCHVATCNGCGSGNHRFRCVSTCGEPTIYVCRYRACGGFCLQVGVC